MPEYPIVVREVGGRNRLGVEDAEALDADVRAVVAEAYERVDVERREDGERVGTVIADDSRSAIERVRWED